ncbi:nSTAND1 domain-containing NTPase [Streptomyces chiangmaiensis]|uniref:Trypsin-like peptidase domain-containing protein n=1 Tax=Streptomyces chiangmaiensis TaxID=766497 RepID=A0ABU7FHR6_9ACTN|nr:trypsin-like peptidase domain-containing protein [Streptomyces chiangmaiensis]MED7823465.1 trypsin-like peptidase domain-containing protein [Streptomyces chiangmaiensis]
MADSAVPGDAAVVRILDEEGRPVGAGFLTAKRDVLTCAHVVAVAVGLPEGTGERPDGPVRLDFPLAARGRVLEARVEQWTPMQPDESGDIAVLRLLTDPPPGAVPASVVEDGAASGRQVRTFGFPAGYDAGVWSVGVLRGRQATGWLQYDTDPTSQYEVGRGFSGAPVWDLARGVVGMVVTVDDEPGRRAAYLIPTETLRECWPPLREAAQGKCPFRDLRPFQEGDAELFHGRDEPAGRIVDQLGVGTGVTLVGASGCGKSSLLNAGVLPRLRARDELLIVRFRPGKAPLAALAEALLPSFEPRLGETARMAQVPQLTQLLREGRMPAVVERILQQQAKSKLLVIADQFEEALVRTDDEQHDTDLDAFAAALGHCLDPGAGLQTVIALRADFLAPALNRPALAPLLDGSRLFMLGPMRDDEVRAAIEQPLSGVGVRYEKGLVKRLLTDLGPDPSRLPLLEFTLTKLWERKEHGVIGHAHYQSLGGVGEALATHAEQVWAALKEEERPKARALLVQLVHPGGARTSPTRRVVARTELPAAQWRIAQRLLTTRLLVPGEDLRTGGAQPVETVELAHEALLSRWQRLAEFVVADQGFRRWQEDLRRRLGQWQGDERAGARLLRGADLRDARNWWRAREDELGSAEIDFVTASISGARRRRITAAAIAMVLMLMAGVGTWAWRYRAEAHTARQSAAVAAGVLAQQSRDLETGTDRGDRYTALLLALRAYRTQDNPDTRALLGEMYRRFGSADLLVPSYAPAAASIAASDGVAASADGRVVASWTADGKPTVWRSIGNAAAGKAIGRPADTMAVSPDGSLIAMVAGSLSLTSGTTAPPDPRGPAVELYDVEAGRVVRLLQRPDQGDPWPITPSGWPSIPSFPVPPGTRLPTQYAQFAFDPTGRKMVALTGIAGTGGRFIVWDMANGKIEKILPGPDTQVSRLSFTSDGQGLVAVGQDLTQGLSGELVMSVRTWDLNKPSSAGRTLFTLGGLDGAAPYDISPDGAVLTAATTRTEGYHAHTTVTTYMLPGGRRLTQRQLPHDQAVTGVAVTARGSRIVAYQAVGDTSLGGPVSAKPGVVQVSAPWRDIALLGPDSRPTVFLTDGLGMNGFVTPVGGDPVGRIPEPATGSAGPVPADRAQRWMDRFCRILGDETLPAAAEQKLPPAAYRKSLCPHP